MHELIKALEFPCSALLAVSFLLTAFAMYRYAGRSRVVRLLGSVRMARVLLAVGAVLLAIEGTWSVPLHRSPVFPVYVLLLLLALAMALLSGFGVKPLDRRRTGETRSQGRAKGKVGFLVNHLGIFLIVWAAFFGAPDVSRSKMMVAKGDAVCYSYMSDGTVIPLPFNVGLEDFTIDYYPDGVSPKQFTSQLLIDGERMSVAVNEPASHKGYTFFQESYDREGEQYTVLLVVRDPWLPVIHLGMVLLGLGSVMLLFGRWKTKFVVPITLLLTLLFSGLTVAKINFGTLMPALRSWWFVPHVFIYMVAYSLMALALVMWIVPKVKKSGRKRDEDHWLTLSSNLVRSSAALLIIGMLTGSVWARQAWGDYWAWDPKENWAAVTWFVSLMHLHLQDKRGWSPFAILLLAFLALQITWYGVNYLPSAMDSMHTYTQ